ncbi:UDP-N-acetylenolpyruvoylglucosamine reductase [Pseudoalteromonas rubra]|uniref:UDP-N-acetylenolpyruvoylglucosamine reductase n=1 Tax=Pseudoalteromonas rubra TaxID=43658 RepID=A0A5S3WHY0_9GAMM|nr:UDP-N-acetylmuramate dehydrogenase [Pseudoalteromonas rubra]TMP26782.1 UDP-N-acetylenolpyruvoylglucosamine reductase [Pseudoalteromonas rubra]TMP30758.1 UDP-N-acetylenolpyruvoylglucosamine reductase [Pseudoalteromonas rubra]
MHSLQSLHTFSLPASCSTLLRVTDPAQLYDHDFSTPFYILGEGSNSVFLSDYAGTVIQMANHGVVLEEQANHYVVRAAAGESWHTLVMHLLAQGIGGLENLVLIPGTIGAAPIQNIGAYGVELADVLFQVTGFDIASRTIQTLDKAACELGYRDSVFKHALKDRFIITEVTLHLPKQWRPVLSYGPLKALCRDTVTPQAVAEQVMATRRSKLPDPQVLANAGSFFKNPVVDKAQADALANRYPDLPSYPVDAQHSKLAAGWLIERAGLKGYQRGGIRVYEHQALVLVNEGHSNGEDLKAVISHIQHTILTQFDIVLEHEVRLIGPQGEITIQEAHYG